MTRMINQHFIKNQKQDQRIEKTTKLNVGKVTDLQRVLFVICMFSTFQTFKIFKKNFFRPYVRPEEEELVEDGYEKLKERYAQERSKERKFWELKHEEEFWESRELKEKIRREKEEEV